MILKLMLFLLYLVPFCIMNIQADVGSQQGHCPYEGGCVRVYGRITEADLRFLKPFFNQAVEQDVRMAVDLDSSGGDVRAAIEIGKLMRRVRAVATMGFTSDCSSSCVTLLDGRATTGRELTRHRIGATGSS